MTVLTRADLLTQFPSINFGSDFYACPTLEWLQSTFYDYFHTTLWDVDADKWTVPWECRDFARAFAHYAQLCNALTPNRPPGTDILAVGEIWFNLTPTTGHAINACFTDKGLVFIEPQTGALYPLTSDQRSSIYFVRF